MEPTGDSGHFKQLDIRREVRTQFFIKWSYINHSNENDLVLDTFLGGGTTAIACKNKNRNFKN